MRSAMCKQQLKVVFNECLHPSKHKTNSEDIRICRFSKVLEILQTWLRTGYKIISNISGQLCNVGPHSSPAGGGNAP